eukprot:2966559-Amphidinium_carterae.1
MAGQEASHQAAMTEMVARLQASQAQEEVTRLALGFSPLYVQMDTTNHATSTRPLKVRMPC